MKNGQDNTLYKSDFEAWKRECRPIIDKVNQIHKDSQYLQHLEKLDYIERSLKTLAWTLPVLVGALCTILVLKELSSTDRNFRFGNILNMDKPVRE